MLPSLVLLLLLGALIWAHKTPYTGGVQPATNGTETPVTDDSSPNEADGPTP